MLELIGLAGSLMIVAALVVAAVVLIALIFLVALGAMALSTRGDLRGYLAEQEDGGPRPIRPLRPLLRAVLRHE